jgi:hypothetical protein
MGQKGFDSAVTRLIIARQERRKNQKTKNVASNDDFFKVAAYA